MTSDIETALIDHLKTMSPSMDIVESVEDPYEPQIDVPYLETLLLPNETNTPSVANNDRHQYLGFLQVTVVFPKNRGTIEARALADQVISHFEQGTKCGGEGLPRVKINRQPWQATHFSDGAWLRIPVSIPYHCMA